ncbi:MAG: anthranilate synthase component I [Chthonomonadales bacterium]
MFTPSRQEFLAMARPGDLIPVYREILADRITPVSAFECIASRPGSFLLESVEGGERLARYSFLGSDPYLTLRCVDRVATVTEGGRTVQLPLEAGTDALHLIQGLLARYRFLETPGLPRFCGGAVGYLSYDMVRHFEKLPQFARNDLNVPDACFLFTDTLLIFDHVRHRVKVLGAARVDDDAGSAYDRVTDRIEALIARLRAPVGIKAPYCCNGPLQIEANMDQAAYEAAVRKCKDYIMAGDAFQIVPSLRLSFALDVHPFEVYRAIRSLNPSPYMYYLDLGDQQVVGTSPEILVTAEKGQARVRPIAGTRPRGVSEEEDARLAAELLADEKERAEHIMLVDLGRNDLGRVCEYGSVRVDELMVVERYSHVMHIVSNVTGRIASGRDVYDVTRACFPAGTLTGAPKVRAMEIIEELEPTRRGLYGGAVGYYSFSGDMDFAIAIRTMLVQNGTGFVQAGAGVVADSVPEAEYRECMNKARALIAAVEMARQGLE